ncbi:MAG: nicotinate-nucleotide adenylyltransferase [Chthonomonadales bacterium]|nr:nicotinate-nucleotide adenylyltransferase [Chthonomonadales bacterium]
MRLGILGGTFDPIHFAHLLVAEDARVQIGLDRVLFIPNGTPAHKSAAETTSPEHRVAMVERAVRANPAFEASRLEIDREGPSYTADTLAALHEANPGADLFFLTGSDAVAEIATWHRPAEVLRLSTIVVAARPGYSLDWLCGVLEPRYMERLVPLTSAYLDISATAIRERARCGLPVRYLTPDPVAAYISEQRLYRATPVP